MTIRSLVMGGALALLLILTPAVLAQEQAAEAAPATMSCGDCHDQAKAFAHNPHARGEVKDGAVPNAVCETCHGDGTAHIESGGEKDKIVVPRGVTGANETCLACHDNGSTHRTSHRTGMHANSAAVNCFSCHAIHSKEARLLARPEVKVCSTCHASQASAFRNKPYTHRLGRGGMSCSSCHEPHGRPGKENTRVTPAGEQACMSCHSDKRGPYVFPHGGTQISADCSNCHDPHGSANPGQLRRTRMAQLCLECHSPITRDNLGSQPPSFHNLNNPRYQQCTSCHVAIHGSNRSPMLLK